MKVNPKNVIFLLEFLESIKYVMLNRVWEGLHLLRISPVELIILLSTLTIVLLLLFVFIFLGISAFALGGSFGTVINSMMPCIAGLGVGSQSPIDFHGEEWVNKLKEIADKVMEMF